MKRSSLFAAALALAVPAVAWAGGDDDFLTIGDRAPKFDIAHWLKGEQVEQFEDGKVYVMEFWATWCGPCVASMPHISELQAKYRDYDVTFIGVSDEPLPTVVEFLFKTNGRDGKVNNDRTQYTLCTDPDESVKNDYFKAAGRTGIPCAFIVGKNQRIEWIGHPMQIDEPLDAVVRDTWDRDAAKLAYEKQQEAQRQAMKLRQAKMEAVAAGDWDKVLKMMDDAIAAAPDNPQLRAEKFMVLAKEMGDYDRAYKVAAEAVELVWDDPMMLNQIAWFIADEPGLEKRDFDVAMKAAKRANELTKSEDPAILDTLARVFYESGDVKKALEWQRKAAEHAKGTPFEEGINEYLQKYEEIVKKDM